MIGALFRYKMWDFTCGTLIYANTQVHIFSHMGGGVCGRFGCVSVAGFFFSPFRYDALVNSARGPAIG